MLPETIPHYTNKQVSAAGYAMSAVLEGDRWLVDEDTPALHVRGPYNQVATIRSNELGLCTAEELWQLLGTEYRDSKIGMMLCKMLYGMTLQAASSGTLLSRTYYLRELADELGYPLRSLKDQAQAINAIRDWCFLIGATYVDVADITNRERSRWGKRQRHVVNDYVQLIDVQVTITEPLKASTVTVTPTRWLLQHRALWYNQRLGNLRDTLALPGARGANVQGSVAWAQVMKCNLEFLWRARLNRPNTILVELSDGDNLTYAPFSRYELLGTPMHIKEEAPAAVLATNPTVTELALSKNPGRLRRYFDGALDLLQKQGVIGQVLSVPHQYARVDEAASRSKGWVEAWLRQLMIVTPGPVVQSDLLAARCKDQQPSDDGDSSISKAPLEICPFPEVWA